MIDPRRRRAPVALAVVALMLMAGCIGFGGDGGSNETGNQTNATPNASDDGRQTRWTRENRSGSVPATSTVVGEQAAEESFQVNGSMLVLNLSADGGEIEMCVQKPGGNESGGNGSGNTSQQQSCDETVTTRDGNATFEVQAPERGEWTVRLTASEASSSEVGYELVIAQRYATEDDGGLYSTAVTQSP